MKQEMLKLAKVAEEFEKAGQVEAGKMITEAMQKIAEPMAPGGLPIPQGNSPAPQPLGPTAPNALQRSKRAPNPVANQAKIEGLVQKAIQEARNPQNPNSAHAANALEMFAKAYAGVSYTPQQKAWG